MTKTTSNRASRATVIKKWRKILKSHPEANFLQSPEWAKANQKIGHKPIIEFFGQNSLALMIVKDARRGRYLEVPGGPLLDWSNHELVETAFTKLRKIAKEHKCVFIRFRPQLENTPENLALLPKDAQPAPFHLHAEHTVMIDLKKSEDDLLKSMRRQTRYEVRRSLKQDLIVKKGNSEELFKLFHEIQSETALRQNFIPPKLPDLLAYRDAFGNDATIYYVCTTNTETTGDKVVAPSFEGHTEPGKASLSAEKSVATDFSDTVRERTGQNLVALGLILASGVEADYFEAASTDLNRKLPGAYALQWQVMRDLKTQGIKRYNLWGIAPKNQPHHRYAKVTTFKTGFGGEITEYIPAQDIIISKPKYLKTYLVETIRKKRRHLS